MRMKNIKVALRLYSAALVAVLLGSAFPVAAVSVSPNTSDSSATMLPIMLGLLGASALLIVIFAVVSVRKKGKGK